MIAYIGNFLVIAYIGNFSDASGGYRNVTLGKKRVINKELYEHIMTVQIIKHQIKIMKNLR